MRLWSLHPKYLDAKGLVALWREGLLAQHVLDRKTAAYARHPQLLRFKASARPHDAINQFLAEVHCEGQRRGYRFARDKIDWSFHPSALTVTNGQVAYEVRHLLRKLNVRDPERGDLLCRLRRIQTHPLFRVIRGPIEPWERVPSADTSE